MQESGTREGLRVCRKCYKRVQESATREGLRSVQEVLRGLRALHTVRLHSQAAALLCQLLI